MRRSLSAAACIAVLSAACGGESPRGVPEGPESGEAGPSASAPAPAPADPSPGALATCVDSVRGFAVSYPESWRTNPGTVVPRCSVFHPGPIEIPRDSEIPLELAITVDVEPVAFATATAASRARRDRSRREVTVAGREALVIEGETTGEGLHDPGIRSYQYFVARGDSTLIASTYDVGSIPFTVKRQVLDEMMETLRLPQPEGTG